MLKKFFPGGIFLLALFSGAVLTADDHMLSSSVDDGLTFYCSFDDSVNAVKAVGAAAGVSTYGSKAEFAAGIKNKGLRIGRSADGKIKHSIRYAGTKNINHKQGTICFWIKPEDWEPTSKDFNIFLTGLKKNGCFFIYKYQGNTARFYIKDGEEQSNSMASTSAWKKGKWYHLAVSWNPQMQQIYVNGKLINTVKRPNDPDQPYSHLFVGSRNWAVEKGFSIIDELKIFNRMLTVAELEKEYSSVAGVDRSSGKMAITVGKGTPAADGKIMPGEYAVSSTGFFTAEGKYARRQGKFHLSWDNHFLYIGIETPQPVPPLTAQMERDGQVWKDDSLEIWLAGKNGKRYQLIYNSKGVIYDCCFTGKKADPSWNIKGAKLVNKIAGKKWISEVVIPLAELGRKPADKDRWKLNIGRSFHAERPRSFICIAPVRRQYGFADVPLFPEITFDASAPKYQIVSIGDINKGAVDLRVQAPASARATLSYATYERVWFKETFSAGKGKVSFQKEFAPGGSMTFQLTDKGKTLYQAGYQGTPPSAVAVQYIYTDIEKGLLQSVAKNEGGATGHLLLTLTDKKSKKVYTHKVPVKADQVFWTVSRSIKELPDGDYDYKAQFINGAGVPEGTPFVQWYRKSPSPTAWDNNKIGIYPGFVPRPWTPMQFKDDTIIAKMQQYAFKGTLLPSGFTANGHQILAAPCRVRINGRYLEKGTFKLLESKPDYILARTEGKLGNVSVSCNIRAEFDGMLWFDLSLNGQKAKITDFVIEIPLKKEFAEQVHSNAGDTHTAKFGATGLVPASGWHKNLYHKPAFWVGSDEAGFAWYAEDLKGWKNKDKNRTVEILPGKNAMTVKLNVIDRPVTLNGARKISFGFHGTPVKKADTSTRWNRVGKEWGWSLMSYYFNYLDSGKEFYDRDYWVSHRERYKKNKATRFFLYIASNGAGPYNPEWAYWGKKWTSRPIGDYIIEYNIKDTKARDKWVWTYSCLNSRSFLEFYLWQISNVLKNKDMDIRNLYYDLVGPRMCNNTEHGCGWRDDDGLLWATHQIRGGREFHKRLLILTQKVLPDCKHLYHVTGQPVVPAVHSFCDAIVEGETFFGEMLTEKETYFGIINPKMFRAAYAGEKWGYSTIFIPQLQRSAQVNRPDRVKFWKMKNPPEKFRRACRHFLGYAYNHDLSLWHGNAALHAQSDPLWAKQAAFMGKWDGKVEFLPYWRKNNPFSAASANPERVFMSAYRRGDRGMLVVMNDTDQAQTVKVTVDPQRLLGKKQITHIEDENGKRLPAGNSWQGTVPRQEFKIYYIK
ncbi:MAG: hypothetical protein IKC65_08470 [Lentisphaeria bacterium]|nr:hypothetical protein [Lentisphaeria bacterium]